MSEDQRNAIAEPDQQTVQTERENRQSDYSAAIATGSTNVAPPASEKKAVDQTEEDSIAVSAMNIQDQLYLDRQREEERRKTRLLLQTQEQQTMSGFALLIALFMGMDKDESLASEESQKSLAEALGIDFSDFSQTVSDYRSGNLSAYDAASRTMLSSRRTDGSTTPGISESQISAASASIARYASTGNPLLELIASKESGGNYNVVFGGKKVNLTDMTVNEVLAWQKNYVRQGSPSSAAGKYQIISKTLEGLKREMGLSGNEKFDESMQDRMATVLLERRGYSKYLAGQLDERTFMKNVAAEWASMPKDGSGRSYYAGDGLNKSLVNPATMVAAMRATKDDALTSTFAQGGKDQTGARPDPIRDGLTVAFTKDVVTAGGTDQVALAARNDPLNRPEIVPSGAKPA